MSAPKPPSPPSAGPPADGLRADASIDDSLLDELAPAEFQALQWSVRMSDGLSPEARTEFQAWIDAAPAHRAAYEDIAGVWDAIGDISPAGNAHIRASVAIDTAAQSAAKGLHRGEAQQESVRQWTEESAPAPTPTPAPQATISAHVQAQPVQVTRRSATRAFAAIASLGVLGAGGWLGWSHWQNQPVFSRNYATERGQNLDVALPDDTRLLLDTATQVEVTLYRSRREVRMPEGQVLFQVQADQARPFDVLAGAARITVVGTKFSVRYTPSLGSQAVQVAVIEGRVRVAPIGPVGTGMAQAVEITAGQTVTADAEGRLGAVTPVVADGIAPWRHRRLSFDGLPLAQVLAEIGRYGDIGVRVGDPVVGKLPVTASVDLRNLSAFVLTLPQVLPVRLERREDGLEIVSSRR